MVWVGYSWFPLSVKPKRWKFESVCSRIILKPHPPPADCTIYIYLLVTLTCVTCILYIVLPSFLNKVESTLDALFWPETELIVQNDFKNISASIQNLFVVGFAWKKNVAFTFISFAVLKWDDCLSVQLPFELPVQIPVQTPVQMLLELEPNLLSPIFLLIQIQLMQLLAKSLSRTVWFTN